MFPGKLLTLYVSIALRASQKESGAGKESSAGSPGPASDAGRNNRNISRKHRDLRHCAPCKQTTQGVAKVYRSLMHQAASLPQTPQHNGTERLEHTHCMCSGTFRPGCGSPGPATCKGASPGAEGACGHGPWHPTPNPGQTSAVCFVPHPQGGDRHTDIAAGL